MTWTENVAIPGQSSKASPALAVFGDRLHMVHLGDTSNKIWHSTFDKMGGNVPVPPVPPSVSVPFLSVLLLGD